MAYSTTGYSIYEGLILRGTCQSDRNYFSRHLDKLLNNYNPTGMKYLFLVSYVKADRSRFDELYRFYSDYMKECSAHQFSCKSQMEIKADENLLSCLKCTFDNGGYHCNVYVIFIDLEMKKEE